jgi:hypothetical protein
LEIKKVLGRHSLRKRDCVQYYIYGGGEEEKEKSY